MPNRMTPSVSQLVQVSFRYPVCFTTGLFAPGQSLLADVVCGSGRSDAPNRLLFVVDGGVAEHHPTLLAGIESYCRHHGTRLSLGLPTAESLRLARVGAPGLPLIASGGLRDGIDAAKAIALGADLAGFAAPLLKAAAESEAAAHGLLTALVEELRVGMFCCGAGNLAALKRTEVMG